MIAFYRLTGFALALLGLLGSFAGIIESGSLSAFLGGLSVFGIGVALVCLADIYERLGDDDADGSRRKRP